MTLERRIDRLEARATTPGVRDTGGGGTPAVAMPDGIVDFVLNPAFLGQPRLYPRQATLLKLICLELERFTDYDLAVISEWTAGFSAVTGNDGHRRYEGNRGTTPDVLDRIRRCRETGRRHWFREVVLPVGRRGSKGWCGAVMAAYTTWHLLALGDPQGYYGLPPNKALDLLVFAAQHDQAKTNQFRDISDIITNSPGFRPFIAKVGTDHLELYTPSQLSAGGLGVSRGGSIRLSARQATVTAGRGPACYVQMYDEMAHTVASGSNRSAEELFEAATPALAQFPTESFCWQASSPWTQTGQFFANYQRGLELSPATNTAVEYDMLVVQLPSFELYLDYDRTGPDGLDAYPGGPKFPSIQRPIYAYDDHARRDELADPERYRVEFLAQWATSSSAFLYAEDIAVMFGPWQGAPLGATARGTRTTTYVAHVDLSLTGANTALVVAHREIPEPGSPPHVIIDLIRVWRPRDFLDGRISQEALADELQQIIRDFPLTSLSFDQYNSVGLIERLNSWAQRERGLPSRPAITEKTATAARNHDTAETFKAALRSGRVHSYYHELADLELRYLELRNGKVDHPTTGPVTTSDIADCLMEATYQLIADYSPPSTFENIANFKLRASHPGGIPPVPLPPSSPYRSLLGGMPQPARRTRPHNPARDGVRRWRP